MTALIERSPLEEDATTEEPPLDSPHNSALYEAWDDTPGIAGFLTSVDHKRIGVRYLVTSLTFLLIGGVEALIMRSQLATPGAGLVGPETYNQLMSMHGVTMLLLFNTPIFAAFGNYVLPLEVGTRDMAFPRLNAMSYWVFLFAGLFMYSSFLIGHAPDGGWFAYTPLTGSEYSPGINLDFWAIGIAFLGISTTLGAVNFIVTTFKLRAPGMSFNRLPLFVWAILAMSFMIIFSLPAVTLAGFLLELDRAFGMDWFHVAGGGDPLLYQHLFWIWGHPEVYIVFIPATGMISMIIAAFTRRQIAAYKLVVAALVATSFISFGLWAHHMFATGIPFIVASFFSAASLTVSIPSGVQMFAWLATFAGSNGRPRFKPPLYWALGFMFIFLLGGITGVMVGVVPWDLQVHDTYFVVAHFHYVLIGGSVFPVFGALHFWMPKITGRMYNQRIAIVGFWMSFIGMNLTFFVQHLLGMSGMPRRVYTYAPNLGWNTMNLISSVGAFVLATGFFLSLVNLVASKWIGPPAGANPWKAETLEWATTSPPPPYNYATFPIVGSTDPVWDLEDGKGMPRIGTVDDEDITVPLHGHHRTMVTSVLDAGSPRMVSMPGPSFWPLVVALCGLFYCLSLLTRSLVLCGATTIVIVVAMISWHVGSERAKGD